MDSKMGERCRWPVWGADLSVGATRPVPPGPPLIATLLGWVSRQCQTLHLTSNTGTVTSTHLIANMTEIWWQAHAAWSQPPRFSERGPLEEGRQGGGRRQAPSQHPAASFLSLCDEDREEKQKRAEGDAKRRSRVQCRIQVPKGDGKWGKALYSSSGKY